MAISMYDACVPTFQQILGCQLAILDKAAAYAKAKPVEPSVLLNARLFPDMLPFKKQIQIMTDMANRGTARLAGLELPSYADDEDTIDALKARVARTLDFVNGTSAKQFEGAEAKSLEIPVGGKNKETMTGKDYLFHFVLPNFLFHATIAYGILRHSGVELGKQDFLRAPR